MFEVREVLRLWLRGEGIRSTERLAGVDRKTVRRYVDAAVEAGLVRDGGEAQLGDVFIGSVVEAVRPHRCDGHGDARRKLEGEHDRIEAWLKSDGLTVRRVGELLERRWVVIPERTLHRYAPEVCDVGRDRRGVTVRVNDGEPGDELQVDFGKLGRILDGDTGCQRDVWALIFTPVVSRYSFVWLSHRQTVDDVIAGFEAAWAFFEGVGLIQLLLLPPRDLSDQGCVSGPPDVRLTMAGLTTGTMTFASSAASAACMASVAGLNLSRPRMGG